MGEEITNPLPPPEPEDEAETPITPSDSLFPIAPTFGKEGLAIEKGKYKGQSLGLFTSGGDAPGMNSCVRAVVRAGLYLGCHVFFIHEGYQGMVDGGAYIKEATWDSVTDIIHKGGTVIGSARCTAFRERSGRMQAARHLIEHSINRLVCIGGDGSLTGANTFRKEWPSLVNELARLGQITSNQATNCGALQIVGLVGSIDNDFCGTDMTIGTDTALHRIVESVDCVRSTAQSHQRAFVIEVMGRHCGYLALAAALAVSADFCFIPEWPPPQNWKEILCKKLKQTRTEGLRVNIVVVAEGAIDISGTPISSEAIRKHIEQTMHYDTRLTVLGHIQRGGNTSAFDRLLGCRMGVEAVIALMEMNEKTEPCVVSIDGNQIVRLPLMKCVEKTKAIKEAMDRRDWSTALRLRGRSFRRNIEVYRMLGKIRIPKGGVRKYKIAIVNVGSPCGGMNAAVMGCVRTAILQGCIPIGVFESIGGLISGKFQELEWNDVSLWSSDGGSHLGTRRALPDKQSIPVIAKNLGKFGINGLVLIGGFSAFHACLLLTQARKTYLQLCIPMCVIPCAIDNNLPGTSFSLGADTSLNEICQMIDKIKKAGSSSKRRVFIVETMGDHCGYLATLAAMASEANEAYIFEEVFDIHDLVRNLREITKLVEGTAQGCLVIRNERASPNYTSEFIRRLYCEEGKGAFSTRTNYLGHTQQGGNPSPFDRICGNKMGAKAMSHVIQQIREFSKAETLDSGTATLFGMMGRRECMTPVEELAEETDFEHRLPREQWWIKLRPLIKVLSHRP